MKTALLLTSLLLFASCTKTVTIFSNKAKIKPQEKFIVLQPQIALKKYDKPLKKAMLGTLVSELKTHGYSYKVVWGKMNAAYGDFNTKIYKATRKVYTHKSNSLEAATKNLDWGESFIANVNLFGRNWSEAMAASKMDPFTPRFVFVSGIEQDGTTFTGNLKLIIYGALIDTIEKSVVWGMSFNFKSAANRHHLVVKAIAAVREMMKEATPWIRKSR